jgi:hypothetical protein
MVVQSLISLDQPGDVINKRICQHDIQMYNNAPRRENAVEAAEHRLVC